MENLVLRNTPKIADSFVFETCDSTDGFDRYKISAKDKKIVIIHDPIIDFVSNGTGIVKNMTYKKLLKYNFGTLEYPSKICLLDELLKNIHTNKIILIELKFEGSNYKEFVDIVYNIIKNTRRSSL